jgi:hypothetical protein
MHRLRLLGASAVAFLVGRDGQRPAGKRPSVPDQDVPGSPMDGSRFEMYPPSSSGAAQVWTHLGGVAGVVSQFNATDRADPGGDSDSVQTKA